MSQPPAPDAATPDPAPAATPDAQVALLDALRAVLAPLSQLAVARGLPFAAVDEVLRAAFVEAAHAAHPGLPEHRRVSRVSVATGINRREVARLLQARAEAAPAPRSYPSEMFAQWTTQAAYRDASGHPLALPRLGPAPSFEALAQAVTRDMHPRSLLEELLRLGLAVHDLEHDTVSLSRETFVPQKDAKRLAGLLGDNVGDHLTAAVANVLSDGRRHLEQALFADGLSEKSAMALREHEARHWRQITEDMIPRLEQMIADDAREGTDTGHRWRLGLYTFHAPVAGAPIAVAAAPKGRSRLPGAPRRPAEPVPGTTTTPSAPRRGRGEKS